MQKRQTTTGKTDLITKVRYPGLHIYCGWDLIRLRIGLCRVRQTDQFFLIDKLHGRVRILILLVLLHIVTTFSLSSMQVLGFQYQYVYSGYIIS